MTKNSLEFVRQKVIEANPSGFPENRPIRLADVLRVFDQTIIRKEWPVKSQLELIQKHYGEIAAHWNLRDDNLDHQSPETLSFLYELLK